MKKKIEKEGARPKEHLDFETPKKEPKSTTAHKLLDKIDNQEKRDGDG